MIRYSLFILAVLGSAATAIASIAPADKVSNPHNITVVAKNMDFPVFGKLEVEECKVEDCSDE
ncbi:MAG: hypothetical protein U1E15_04930 [Hyphomicrobiales bacterium]